MTIALGKVMASSRKTTRLGIEDECFVLTVLCLCHVCFGLSIFWASVSLSGKDEVRIAKLCDHFQLQLSRIL